jgi:competence protein ComEC
VSVLIFCYSFFFIKNSNTLTLAFLNVGQGDAIYIKTNDGTDGLVDGGPDRSVLREIGRIKKPFDRRLGFILVSNPDKDHISGLIDILRAYDVQKIFLPGTRNDTLVMDTLLKEAQLEGAEVITLKRGQKIFLSKNVYLQVLFPDREAGDLSTNTGSAVARLIYKNFSVMLMGDAPSGVEEYLVHLDANILKSDVLKVGHHGSNTSSSEKFLSVTRPKYAVISVGQNNKYGHPHDDVIKRLASVGAEILRTDKLGTVIFYSDGLNFWRK